MSAQDNCTEVKETLDKIKKYLECPICLELLSDPYTTQCGHSFCRHCIHTFIASTKYTRCPLCKVSISRRSMNKSACLSDIIDSVQHLEEAMRIDMGVMNTPPRHVKTHSHECSATPGLIIHSLLHPTPFKPSTMPQQASSPVERNTSPVIQRKTKNNIRKTNNRRQKSTTRKLPASTSDNGNRVARQLTLSDDQPSCSNQMEVTPSLDDVVVATTVNGVVCQSLLIGQPCSQQSSTCHLDDGSDNVTVKQCVNITGSVSDTDMMLHPSSPLQQARSSADNRTSEQDVLSIVVFTSPPTCVSDHKVEVTHSTCVDDPLGDESPTPVNIPVCSSTPDKSHTMLCMSHSPSIPLQNITVEDGNHSSYKVDVTPVVLPKRMIALEGLYQADSDHDHDSLDMFGDTALSVLDNQPVNNDLNVFKNTATLVANPINNNQDGTVDNVMSSSQKPVKDGQDVLDDLFDNTALVLPSNQPVKDNQGDIDMVVDTAPLVLDNKPVNNNQDGNNLSVDTASLPTDDQDRQISAAHQNRLDNQNGLDKEVPTTSSKQLIKAHQNGIILFDKTSTVELIHKPVKDVVISPALFTPDQASLPHSHNDSPMDTSPSSAIGDSISTQDILQLQQQLEQKQNEIASLSAAIQEKSSTGVAVGCSNNEQLTLTISSSVKTVDDSCPVNISSQSKCVSQQSPVITDQSPGSLQSSVTQQTPITPSTQMNTMALFQCADQILTGLKKTLKTDRVLAPIDVNVQSGGEAGKDLFHTPAAYHHMRITRPSSDQPRRHMSSLHTERLNSSADVLPSGVSLTTSGLTISEIEKVQRLAEMCHIQYNSRLSSHTTHLVMATNGKVCSRTPKYLQGLLRGLWIINYDWVLECLRSGRLVDEMDYEVIGDGVCSSNIPRRARMTKLKKSSQLLLSYTIVLVGEVKGIGTRALTSLILLAGGKSSQITPSDLNQQRRDKKLIAVCDPAEQGQLDLAAIRSSPVVVVKLEWLLDSMSYYKLQPVNEYLIK